MPAFCDTVTALAADIARYAAAPDEVLFAAIGNRMTQLGHAQGRLTPDEQASLEKLLATSAKIEAVWGLLAAMLFWDTGQQHFSIFFNVWNCAKFAGMQSRFSRQPPHKHLAQVTSIYQAATNAAPFIIAGNALRQLHRYGEAESSYLQGLIPFPDDPFLKFRLVDLWLATYQPARADQMLASLRSRYPYALEMLFALPIPENAMGLAAKLPELCPDGTDVIWLVAADPVYLERYGVNLARSLAACIPDQTQRARIKMHVHVVKEADTTIPLQSLQTIGSLFPTCVTQRTLDLSGVSPNQRAALFACERFLFLAEILAKYDRPLLVTDIDVECLKDPLEIFDEMGDTDIAYTRFGNTQEAWDRYPATALLVKPTAASKAFFQKLATMLAHLLTNHLQPWFADQIALFRLIEGGLTDAKLFFKGFMLTDADSPKAYFRILHASLEKEGEGL